MESNLQQNFNVGFTNMKSDVLVHLTQWQYWWWFWFSLLWAFYYLMILKMVRFRSLKFRPRLATTFRPHGKWGDLIVCIIPVSWCANIITNSNFILRMIEWQSESGLLTVRIRGKQWYWVYKFELKTFTDVFTVPKNIGHNKWQISTPNDLQVADDYLHVLQLRSQNRWVKSYWEELSKEMSKSKNFHMISPKEYVYSSMFDIYKTIVNGEVVSSLNGYSEITVDDVTYIYNRFLLCDKIQTYLLRADLLKNSLNVEFTEQFIMSEELLESFIKILNENPVSRNSFLYLANCMKGFDENVESRAIDVILDKFDLPTRLNKNRTVGEDKLVVDFSDENLLKDYLKIVTTYNLNTNFVNFNLIYKINEFFRDNFISKLDEDDYHYWHSDPVMTLAQFEEAVEAYKNTPEREHIDNFFESMFDDFEGDVDSLLGDRIWLNNRSVYTDFLVRLSNKKSNWDESGLTDSFSESFKFFLTNDDVFESRFDEVDHLNGLFINRRYSMSEKYTTVTNEEYTYSDFNEFDRTSRKSQGTVSPVRLIKYPVSNKTNFDFSSDVIELFRFRFNENEASVEHRITPNSAFLIIRQKRYKRRKVILPRTIMVKDEEGVTTKKVKSANYTFLSQNSIILENDFNATKRYKLFRKNKMRDELTNLVLSKRMLRTRRTLVLPAHLNITAITNSFDVVHSWFIPGLGLKMDAVPGRATHHTFYIDNVGFYYGQCAEICGRYHHHMPIRICALPFEHFLLWWQSFGLPKLLFTRNLRRYSYSYGSRKYAW